MFHRSEFIITLARWYLIFKNTNSLNLEICELPKMQQIFSGAAVEIFVDDNDTLTGLHYQMKEDFRKYPDIILLDATYNNCLMPLYVILCVDGNDASQLAMVCLTVSDTQEAITKMIQTFKKHNPALQKVRFVMTDKDMVERSVIKREMPQVELGLCLFHTLRSFKRDVTTSKMGISQDSCNKFGGCADPPGLSYPLFK